ncbi:MAG: Ig-like domain-containing protein [Pseudomonadota bacterium]
MKIIIKYHQKLSLFLLTLLLANLAFFSAYTGCGSGGSIPSSDVTTEDDPILDPTPTPTPSPPTEGTPSSSEGDGAGDDGGGDDPTPDTTAPEALVTPANHSTILNSTSIVIQFNESMDPGSLILSGILLAGSDGGTWSTTTHENDTLTIDPTATWPTGTGTLTINANDLAANPLAALNLIYGVQVVYASPGAAGSGTMDSPFGSINQAITVAEGNLLTATWDSGQVHASQGVFEVDSSAGTNIEMAEGVCLYGGYSATNWTNRNVLDYVTTVRDINVVGGVIDAPNAAVEAGAGLTADTTIDGFNLEGGGGNYSAAIFNHDGSELSIMYNSLDAGEGALRSYGIYNNGSAPNISYNTINGGDIGNRSFAIYNDNSSPLIDSNYLDGGNALIFSHGIYNLNSSAVSIINNIIEGGSGVLSYGIDSENSSVTIRNNTINSGSAESDEAYGVHIRNEAVSPFVIENNIIFTSVEAAANGYGIFEYHANSDPTSVRNNNIYNCPTALYFDRELGEDFNTICTGNFGDPACASTLSTPTSSGNISEILTFDANYAFTGNLDAVSFDSAGLDGSLEAPAWVFTDDLEGFARTGDGTGTGWSMGGFEYD